MLGDDSLFEKLTKIQTADLFLQLLVSLRERDLFHDHYKIRIDDHRADVFKVYNCDL